MEALEVFLVLHEQSSDVFRHARPQPLRGKIHTEKCCNVSGELIYVPFRAVLWAASIHNVRSPGEAPPHPPPLFYIQPLWRLGLCECLF